MKYKQQYVYYLASIEKRSMNTIEGYVNDIETFEKWLKATCKKSLLNATTDDIDTYTGYCTVELGNASSTINKKLAGITKYYAYCVKKQGLNSNPAMEATKQKIKKKDPKFLTEKEVTKLLNAVRKDKRRGVKEEAKIRDYAMLKILVAGGLRVSELCKLKPEHIDFENQVLYVVGGKGDKDRAIPLGQSTIEAIKEYISVRDVFSPKVDNIFVANSGKPFNRTSMNQKLKVYCDIAGLDAINIHPHTLRHTCATITYSGSGNIRAVQDLLGHTSTEMVSKYIHMVESQVRDVVMTNKFA